MNIISLTLPINSGMIQVVNNLGAKSTITNSVSALIEKLSNNKFSLIAPPISGIMLFDLTSTDLTITNGATVTVFSAGQADGAIAAIGLLFKKVGGGAPTTPERFGIEDIAAGLDRLVDQGGKELDIYNANKVHLRSVNAVTPANSARVGVIADGVPAAPVLSGRGVFLETKTATKYDAVIVETDSVKVSTGDTNYNFKNNIGADIDLPARFGVEDIAALDRDIDLVNKYYALYCSDKAGNITNGIYPSDLFAQICYQSLYYDNTIQKAIAAMFAAEVDSINARLQRASSIELKGATMYLVKSQSLFQPTGYSRIYNSEQRYILPVIPFVEAPSVITKTLPISVNGILADAAGNVISKFGLSGDTIADADRNFDMNGKSIYLNDTTVEDHTKYFAVEGTKAKFISFNDADYIDFSGIAMFRNQTSGTPQLNLSVSKAYTPDPLYFITRSHIIDVDKIVFRKDIIKNNTEKTSFHFNIPEMPLPVLGGVQAYLYVLAHSVNGVEADVTGNVQAVNVASNFTNDTTAAAGGIAVGSLYHTAGVVKIRLV